MRVRMFSRETGTGQGFVRLTSVPKHDVKPRSVNRSLSKHAETPFVSINYAENDL